MYFTNDLNSPEGPVILEDGKILCVEMNAGYVSLINSNGK